MTVKCGCKECEFNSYGDCEAEELEVDTELTAAGFLQICQTYTEKED